MLKGDIVFSMIFLLAFAIYFYFGIYIIRKNSERFLNRIFFMLTLSLSFWAAGFALANSAQQVETVVIWRRVSAVGWTTGYALILHYILVLVTEKQMTEARKKSYFLLYIPAIICLFVFSLYTPTALDYHQMQEVKYGWINTSAAHGWDYFFYSYYISYILASIGLLINWYRESDNPNNRAQAKLLIISLLTVMVLGSFTDMIMVKLADVSALPQLGPLIVLILIYAFYYSNRKYELMEAEPELIEARMADQKIKNQLYGYLSIGFLSAALLIFASITLNSIIWQDKVATQAYFSSGILFVVGILMLLVKMLRSETIKDSMMLVIVLASIPALMMVSINSSMITAWAAPLLILMIAAVWDSMVLLILTTVVAIVTQLVFWVSGIYGEFYINNYNYMLRIGTYVIGMFLAFFVNYAYQMKMRENEEQVAFQKLISDISLGFVRIKPRNAEAEIDEMMRKIAVFFKVDKAALYVLDKEEKIITKSYIVHAEYGMVTTNIDWTTDENSHYMELLDLVMLQETIKEMKARRQILIYNRPFMRQNIEEAADSYRQLAGFDNIRLITMKDRLIYKEMMNVVDSESNHYALIPLQSHKGLMGLFAIDSFDPKFKWHESQIGMLEIVANLMAEGIMKINAEQEMEYLAYYDQLTGLINRTIFTDRLDQAISLAKRNGNLVGVLYMDLDSFKTVNDSIGHIGGDDLIKQVGKALEKSLRKHDTVSRSGGDEFMLILNNIADIESLRLVVDKIKGVFKRPFDIFGNEFFVTASMGVAVYPYDGDDADTLLKNADTAMHEAKIKGKNQYIFCTEDMKAEIQRNIQLSNNLYRVVERGELTVHYQPQVNTRTGEISGAEALLRWEHPGMGHVSPAVFIPLAEKNGAINNIGHWVLTQAVNQLKFWHEMGYNQLTMAVNLSIIQFNNPNLVKDIEGILFKANLAPQYLELEITESVATSDSDVVESTLQKLKELGVKISIDDFGTEYSSLGRLKNMPLDKLKIDMQFIRNLDHSIKDKAITQVIINLAKKLELTVVAEGVETESQRDFLRLEGCDTIQGYFYYKPMPADEATEALVKDRESRLV